MSTGTELPCNRTRFLIIHDDCVALDQRGPFRDICMALTDRGADVHVIEACSGAEASELASDAASCNGYDAVIVAGGGATLGGVQAGIPNGALPIGVLPIGPGAMLGRVLGLRGKPRQTAASLCTAPAVGFPGVLARGHALHVMAGFGTDNDVLGRLSQHLCPSTPHKVSAASLAPQLFRQVQRFDAVVDGMNYRCCALFVARSSGFARLSGMPVKTSDRDGALTAILVEADDRTALFDAMVSAKLGRLFKDKSITVRACHHVEVSGEAPICVQFDGHAIDANTTAPSPMIMTANPAAVSMIAAHEVAEQMLRPAASLIHAAA